MLAQADVKGAIKADMIAAKQEAAELLRRAEEERREILSEGKRQAALAREEAATRGASAAFAQAAEEALIAFRKRADRYAEAADDIRTLAVEIAKKVLGTDPDLASKDVERLLSRGLQQLRAKRKVRVQVSPGRRAELSFERPNLMKAVDNSPDLLVEDADDVREGFARVVTEVGGALCAEESAFDAVALAVNIKETPRARDARGARSTGVTHVGPVSTGEASGDRDTSRQPRRTAAIPALPLTGNDDDNDDDDDISEDDGQNVDLPDAAVDEASLEDAPYIEADSDEDDPEDFDVDATRALPARIARPRPPQRAADDDDDVAGGVSVRPPSPSRVPTGRVEVRGRAATRVLAVDEKEHLVEKTRNVDKKSALAATGEGDVDDEMDLFTDAKPMRR